MDIESTISDIARFARYYRKKSKLSQEELALYAGVGKTVIYDIEHGKSTVKLITILRVLAALNIKIILQGPIQTGEKEND